MNSRLVFLLLACSFLAIGQVTPNSVTVTATRNANLQPDLVIFAINVDAPIDATRDEVLAALQGSGLTAANFSGVRTVQLYEKTGAQYLNALEWTFTLPAPVANMKETIGLLSAVQSSLAKKNNGMSMTFSVQGLQVSPQAQGAQACSLTDLLSDARTQAQKLASAAGATAGAVLAIVNAAVVTETGNPFAPQAPVTPVCSITVRFALSGGF